MKCSYQRFDCDKVDTSGMVCIDCAKCEHYDNGIRQTGATPNLAWLLKKLRKLFSF